VSIIFVLMGIDAMCINSLLHVVYVRPIEDGKLPKMFSRGIHVCIVIFFSLTCQTSN